MSHQGCYGHTHLITEQKIKVSIKDFSSKCDQIWRNLSIWSHLLMENFIFFHNKCFNDRNICPKKVLEL